MFRTKAVVTIEDAGPVLAALLDHLEEHATVIRTERGARLSSPFGTVDIARRSDTVLVDVASGSAEVLAMIKIFIAEHVFEFAGEAASIVWSGDGASDALPPHFQKLVVSGAFDVTPRMRRVLFSCENIAACASDAGYHIRLLLPPPGRPPRWPTLAADGRMQWPAGEDALVSRVYTIRSIDPDSNTIAVDFVLHDHAGPGAAWGAAARAGDVAGMLGPGGGSVAPAARYLLAGDETALPAIARLLETLPAQARGLALIEVADAAEEQAIANRTAIEVRWLHRDGAAPGTTTLLPDAVMALPGPAQGDDLFVWASCEFSAFKAIRAHVRKQWNLAKENHLVTSYWRRGSSEETAGHPDAATDAAATVGRRLGLDVE